MGPAHYYRDKFWWWSDSFDFDNEFYPPLEVTAARMDDPSIQAIVSRASNARADNFKAMLVMIRFPSKGCWRITGRYKGTDLHLVLSVEEPPKPPAPKRKPWHE